MAKNSAAAVTGGRKMQEVGAGGQVDTFIKYSELKKGAVIAGTYLGFFETEGKFGKSKTYKIQLEADNSIVGLSGTGMLHKRLAPIPEGTYVQVTYLGKKGTAKEDPHGFRIEREAPETL